MPTGTYDHTSKKTGKLISCIICKTRFYVPKCYLNTKKCCNKKCKDVYIGRIFKGRKNTWWQKAITPERNLKISEKLSGRKLSADHINKARESLKLFYKNNEFKITPAIINGHRIRAEKIKGKPRDEKTKEKIREGNIRVWKDDFERRFSCIS